ncbi:type II toxin-antitoxin system HigB family toxin [Anabaena sphaerica FACHB-251]|uniref:Type II toxin-antitoxin system HigB family toxin n=1 Tax=Anabaena sphaerica FACHB-251 TaxID=2692883 RepID=A0A926WNR4_9NOST|nr:type II toxin-antitoxin system HigB family toxin [Anabaena sphaerica]MBD2296846.1 type II toxin-antitoxin system HigB family toxin [Anabaena sphaerica FACHB-251]
MRIISEKRLKEAYEKYPDANPGITAWKKIAEEQNWNNFADVKANVPFAPDLVKNFVIFDIGGNKYRLITRIEYKKKAIYIRGFITHIEYDKNKWKNDEWFDS